MYPRVPVDTTGAPVRAGRYRVTLSNGTAWTLYVRLDGQGSGELRAYWGERNSSASAWLDSAMFTGATWERLD